jgi:DNA replication protein DnaC
MGVTDTLDETERQMLAAKLEQARQRAAAPPDTPSSEGWQHATPTQDGAGDKRGNRPCRGLNTEAPSGKVEDRPAECRECSETFMAKVVVIGTGDDARTLDFPTVCPECIRKADEAVAEAEMRRQMAERSKPDHAPFIRKLEAGGISPNLYEATLPHFDASENPEAHRKVRGFVKSILNPTPDMLRWLYLWGPVGTGKSFLLVGAARGLHVAGFAGKVIIDSAPHLVRRVQSGYGKGESDRIVEARVAADVWFLDDLGRGKQKDDAVSIVSEILHAREGRWTFVTGNYTREGLPGRHEDYETLASRLGPRFCITVEVKGRDRREDAPE